MSDFILEREIRGLQGDLNMNKIAVKSVQEDMREQLSGEMGEDMTAVLNGERVVRAGMIERKKHKVKSWFKRLFRLL
jgi:hypothetical protein